MDEAIGIFLEGEDWGIIEEGGALFGGGGDEVDEEAGVIELAIEVDDTPGEAIGFEIGEAGEGGFFGEELGGTEAKFAGEELIDFEADAIERAFPPGVTGDDEGEFADEVGGILAEEPAFFEGLHDEGDVALFEVANAPVDEFGAPAGGAFSEVVLFEEEGGVASGGGIEGDADAGGAAADDDDVPRAGVGLGLGEHGGAVHDFLVEGLEGLEGLEVGDFLGAGGFSWGSQSLARLRALFQRERRWAAWSRDIWGSKILSIFQWAWSSGRFFQKPTAKPAR